MFDALQGGLIQMAELAWHQGRDLYSWNNSRLFTCMVCHALCLSPLHSADISQLHAVQSLTPQGGTPVDCLWCHTCAEHIHAWVIAAELSCFRPLTTPSASFMLLQEFHAYITLGGKPPECDYPLKGIGFLPCGWGEGSVTWLHVMHAH